MTITVSEAGKRGGMAKASRMSDRQRSDHARKMAAAKRAKRERELEKAKATALVILNEKAEGAK